MEGEKNENFKEMQEDDYRFVIPASGLLGASFLLVVDILCRNITTSKKLAPKSPDAGITNL